METANEEVFVDLELLAARAPEVRDNGDVIHHLYVGTPRTRFCDGDGNIELMAYACLLCAGAGTSRQPFRTPTGIVEHLRGYHGIKERMSVPKGKVSKSHIAGKEIEAGMEGLRDERAIVDHPCNFCHGMIRSGSVFKRAEVDGATRDACVPCVPKLRAEIRRAVAPAPAGDATNTPDEVTHE